MANDRTLAASVGSQVGRSPFLLLFDKHGALIEAMDNPYKNAGNAGVSTVELLASKGINVLVSEGFGPKIVGVMKEKGIRAVEFSGSVSAALKKVRQQ